MDAKSPKRKREEETVPSVKRPRTDVELVEDFKQTVKDRYTEAQLNEIVITDEILQRVIGFHGYNISKGESEHSKARYTERKWGHLIEFAEYVYAQSDNIKKTSISWLAKSAMNGDKMALDCISLWSDMPYLRSIECVVCMDRPGLLVIVPCMHMCVCGACSRHLNRCPICRGSIDKISQVHVP
jgi:hypothetical protein